MKPQYMESMMQAGLMSIFILFTLAVNAQVYLPLRQCGTVQKIKPSDIAASPFSLGCETLDRELWDPDEVYPWLAELPVKWARLQTGWARTEKIKGEYDWEWLDQSVDGLLEIGIQPWFNVGYGNPHYTGGGARYHPMVTEESLEAFKNFVAALAVRYREKVSCWEIWNEPNLPQFWNPDTPDPELYARLVAETAPIIRKYVPDATIIGGVTAGIPLDFIKRIMEAGTGQYIDVFSFHPYRTIPEKGYPQQIEALRGTLKEYNPDITIWQGETGFPSAPKSTGFSGEGPWTEMIQAKIMLRRLLTDISLDIPLTNWFIVIDLHDYPRGTGNVNYKGILRAEPVISPKPAFEAMQNIGSLIQGEIENRNTMILISVSDDSLSREEILDLQKFGTGIAPDIYSAAFNTRNGMVLAYWSVEKARDDIDSEKATISFWDGEGQGFADPVLVDPLTGCIYEIQSAGKLGGELVRQDTPSSQIFWQLPVVDYPLLIMERKPVMRIESK